ncbi:MAG: helix-turn-helix domain-containing protein [Bdellovibrionaceae bacterium]|nr:helix-turn-helix domain-containing protein [Pseudobdellovibrionaceae bacterium]
MEYKWSPLLMRELKDLIKQQGYNYKNLSKELGMSESGFKKLINSDDCSLQKIEKITNIIGIRLMDLFSAIEEQHLKEKKFTPQQEEFFTSKREAFLLYWLLVYERRELLEAQDLLQLDTKKCNSLLRKMDSLNLLKVLAGDKLRLPQPQGIKWTSQSQFVFDLYKKWGQDLLTSNLQNMTSESDNKYFSIRYLKMSANTWKELVLDLENLEKKIINTAVREMRMKSLDLHHVRWLWIADQNSWAEQELHSSTSLDTGKK